MLVPNFGARPRRSPILWLLFSLKGRLSRRIYWPAYLAILSLNIALGRQILHVMREEIAGQGILLLPLIAALVLYAHIAISVKRLHDVGYSGFLAVAVLIPFVGFAFNIWVGILPGAANPNQYGDAPDVPPA
jgi:uncharacterized membrane protein YhaH (DUF805 family)